MDTEGKYRPPRFVKLLVGLLLDETELEELDELFARRVDLHGVRVARRAYLLELWWGLIGRVWGEGWNRRSGGPLGRFRRAMETNGRVGMGMFEGMLGDIRIAGRRLRKAPGFLVAAVAILALGIGANTTAYGAFRMAVLSPPPFPDPETLVTVDLWLTQEGEEERLMPWPHPQYLMLKDWDGLLVGQVANYKGATATLTGIGTASMISVEVVSPGFFEILDRPPVLGRSFAPEEADIHGAFRVTVISHEFWQNRLGEDPAVLGRQFRLNGETFRVVGVAPPGFRGLGREVELWIPFGATEMFWPGVLGQPYNYTTKVIGRLAPSASLAAVDAQLSVFGSVLTEAFPRGSYTAGVRSFSDVWENPGAKTAATLFALAAGILLLVACANLSGLLLARARRVVRDGAVRMALGASRWRLIRAALVESLIIATLGGLIGVGLSKWGTSAVALFWPSEFRTNDGAGLVVVDPGSMTIDEGTIVYALMAVLITAVLVGLVPAFRVSSADPSHQLKAGTGGGWRGRSVFGLDAHSALVAIQQSLALVLLIGAGLVGTSVKNLLGVEDGFRTENLLTFDYSQPAGIEQIDLLGSTASEWVDRTAASASFDEMLNARLTGLPGIEATTTGCRLLQSQFCAWTNVSATDGRPDYEPYSELLGVVSVGDHYFELMDIPVLQGRAFTPSDGLDSEPVVILSSLAAQIFFPDGNPLGKSIGIGFSPPGRRMARVVGVVDEVRHTRPDQDPAPAAYFSSRERRFGNHVIVRTVGESSEMVRSIQDVVTALDPTIALSSIETADQIIGRGIGYRRMILGLLAAFGAITIMLVAVGTGGVVANAVADRRKELGIRLALGAMPGNVVQLFVRRSLRSSALGVGIGLWGAWLSSGLLKTFLWQVGPRDPASYLGGAGFLLVIVAGASYLPARNAAKVSPVTTLKAE